MSCCKDSKYNLLLTFDEQQKNDLDLQQKVIVGLSEALDWSIQRSTTAVEFASDRGFCLLESSIIENISKSSVKLAQRSIPHSVKLSKK